MTNEQLKIFAEMFKDLGLTQLKVNDKDFELVLKKEVKVVTTSVENVPVVSNTQVTPVENIDNIGTVENAKEEVVNCSLTDVNAPLVGVFYSAPSPEKDAFVKVGDRVNKGDILCVIEAMKMFNEIKAETSGIIAEICVDNGNVVEYGQTLFKIAMD